MIDPGAPEKAMRVQRMRDAKRGLRKSAAYWRSRVSAPDVWRLPPDEDVPEVFEDRAEYEQIMRHYASIHDAELEADGYDA